MPNKITSCSISQGSCKFSISSREHSLLVIPVLTFSFVEAYAQEYDEIAESNETSDTLTEDDIKYHTSAYIFGSSRIVETSSSKLTFEITSCSISQGSG